MVVPRKEKKNVYQKVIFCNDQGFIYRNHILARKSPFMIRFSSTDWQ